LVEYAYWSGGPPCGDDVETVAICAPDQIGESDYSDCPVNRW
jgi:hypothetical protein